MGPVLRPFRATACERALTNGAWDDNAIAKASTALFTELAPVTDIRASREYRQAVAGNLLLRFYHATTRPDGASTVWNYRAPTL